MTADRQATSAERLDEHLSLYPHLTDRILRQMLVELHARDLVNIDEIYDEARAAGGYVESLPPSERGNPNVAAAPRGDQNEKDRVNDYDVPRIEKDVCNVWEVNANIYCSTYQVGAE